jgi:argininosuccinate lyase
MVYNSLDATSSRDHVSEFVSCVAIMCVNLSRMAEDLVLWASDEFGFVEIADRSASPSSAMPQKKNPDVLELVRGKAAGVIGDLVSVLAVQKGLASGYGRDLQETKEPAWRAAEVAAGSLQMLFEILTDMTVNKARMAQAAESGNIIALDVAEELVRHKVPFREAHLEVGKMVAAARRAGKQILELTKVEISGACSLDTDKVARALSACAVNESANRRRSAGGTSRQEQERMISDVGESVGELFGELEEQRNDATEEIGKMWQEIDTFLKG